MATLNRRKDNVFPRRGRNLKGFYQSERWHRLSRDFRKKNPLCKKCLEKGETKMGQCVDHIIPLIEWNGDQYDCNNLQTLCLSCHSQKTVSENKGWSKK